MWDYVFVLKCAGYVASLGTFDHVINCDRLSTLKTPGGGGVCGAFLLLGEAFLNDFISSVHQKSYND